MNLHPRRLAELPVFKTVPEADLAELARHLLPATMERGGALYREGEPAKDAVIVLAGRLSVSVGGKTVGDGWPGDILGEAGLFGAGASRSATVTAMMDTDVAILTMAAMEQLTANRAVMALEQKLLVQMTKRFRTANARLEMADRAAAERPRPAPVKEEPQGFLASLFRIFGGAS